jgi:hypothetical protein
VQNFLADHDAAAIYLFDISKKMGLMDKLILDKLSHILL